MKTVVITDGKYRTSLAAARMLARGGYRVAVTQTRGDAAGEPPVFASAFVSDRRWIDGKVTDGGYIEALLEYLRTLERPVLLPVGAGTLNLIAENLERFREVAELIVSPKPVLDALNDKEQVHRRCLELEIPVPLKYDGEPDEFPVVVKPHCGEKAGLKAKNRYLIANNKAEFDAALESMRRYDASPIVQQRVTGDGGGASLLIDSEGRLVSALCHRRIREYPITGGPSTCCESIYAPEKVDKAYRLLRSFGFTGLAMVEFKGDYVLEVNPRIWGSFSLTEASGSPIACRYALAACGEALEYAENDYERVRMRFLLNDTAAMLSLLKHGKMSAFGAGLLDVFRAKEAMSCKDDKRPMRVYLRNVLKRNEH